MPSNFDINQLQAYLKQKRAEYVTLTKPGYEIYFFSRFNTTADIIGDIQNVPSITSDHVIKTLASGDLTPNCFMSSNLNHGDIAAVKSIKIHNTVQDIGGSSCDLEIINPDGIDYFKPTIGTVGVPGSFATTDYDDSQSRPINVQRIGVMDTVLIRLKNSKTVSASDPRDNVETVFRGVIKSINRSVSSTGGSILTIRLGDFSEFLRQITALPLGLFSTISFSITGRQLVDNLIKYSNRIYTGDWRFLGADIAQAFRTAATAFLGTTSAGTNTDQTAAIAATNATNHQMTIPPFFYLEYSNKIVDINPAGSNLPPITGNKSSSDVQQQTSLVGSIANSLGSITGSLEGKTLNFLQGLLLQQTPEDQETIRYYQVALQKAYGNPNLNKFSTSVDAGVALCGAAEKYAWILSDLYLDKGLITFEHQKIWPTMFNAAQRSMRECYFDFAPKLAPGALHPYDTATVPEQNNPPSDLADVHPNIGIVKYRLSPCLLPYDENNVSQIFQWSISDDVVVNYNTMESEEEVFTAVFGFGSAVDQAALAEKAVDVVVGQNKGLLAFAQSIDPNLEQRIGYRFMTDHDQKVRIPILIYLTSYVMLMQSQMNMFTAQVTVVGNPKYKPGSVIRLLGRHTDYYCTDVIHNWSIEEGYTTVLVLAYGHTSGILPAALTGGAVNDNVASNEQCQLRAAALSKYISKDIKIGGVNAHCLVSAMWQFMTCGASTDDAMKMASPEYENSGSTPPTYSEWIDYVWPFANVTWDSTTYPQFPIPKGFQNYSFDTLQHQIINEIQWQELDKYNVTYNLVKNLVHQESSFVQNAVSFDSGYGLFQITPGNSDYIFHPPSAISKAMQILKGKFVAEASPGCSGTSFLNALAAYNGSPSYTFIDTRNGATKPYVNSVLGDAQVYKIANNQQLPAGATLRNTNSGLTCQPAGPGLKQWPYPVYGPIGERLDAYLARHPGSKTADAKTALNTFSTGMTEAASYITSLLTIYKNKPLANAGAIGTQGAFLNANDVMQKVIAAWFSNENIASLKAGEFAVLQTAVNGIKQYYTECMNCTGQSSSPIVGQNLNKSLALSQINFIAPCLNPEITSPFGPRSAPQTRDGVPGSSFHQGVDYANKLTPYGTPDAVIAPADGYVIYNEISGQDGYNLIIVHGNQKYGIISRFFDLWNVTVRKGENVKQGQTIAQMATSAQASHTSGTHVHWELRFGSSLNISTLTVNDIGTMVNPVDYLSH